MSCRQLETESLAAFVYPALLYEPPLYEPPEVRVRWFRDVKNKIERLLEIQLLQNEKLRIQNEKLLDQNAKLRDETGKLRDNINDLISCQICSEQFQSAGERVACKLDCPHIMCKKCAEEWLKNVSLYYLPKV